MTVYDDRMDYDKLNHIVLLDGEEIYQIEQIKNQIIHYFLEEETKEFNLDHFETFSFQEIYNASETLPFLSDRKIVLVDHIELTKQKLSMVKSELEQLESYIDNIPKSTLILLISKGNTVFKSKVVKKIEKCGNRITFKKLNREKLRLFIKEQLYQYHYPTALIEQFIEKTRYLDKNYDKNLYDVLNEIEKLKDHVEGDRINLEDLEALSTNYENNIFKLMDHISKKEFQEAVYYYDQLTREKDDSYRIFFMIVRQLRNLLFIKELARKKYDTSTSIKLLGLSSFEYRKLSDRLKQWKYQDLREGIHLSYQCELALKTTSCDQKEMVENFMLRLLL